MSIGCFNRFDYNFRIPCTIFSHFEKWTIFPENNFVQTTNYPQAIWHILFVYLWTEFVFFCFGQLCKMPNKIFMLIAGLFEFIQWAIQLLLIPLHKQNPLLFTSHQTVQFIDYITSCIATCLVFAPHTKYNPFKSGKILSSYCCYCCYCCCFFLLERLRPLLHSAFCFNNKTMRKEENLFSFLHSRNYSVSVDKFITLPVTKCINIWMHDYS